MPSPGEGTDEASTDASDPSGDEQDPAPVDARDIRSAVIMGIVFVGSIVLAMLIARALMSVDVPPVFEDPEDPTNPLLYLVLVVVFTAAILVIAKLGLNRVIQFGILAAIFFLMVFIYRPLLDVLGVFPTTLNLGISVGLALILTAFLYYYPEWYIVDAVGISVAAGATGWFGFSFGLVPALVLLIAFAVYDAIAVYRTEHMLDLADQVMGLRLPIMVIVPKTLNYSFLGGEPVTDAEVNDQTVERDEGVDTPKEDDERQVGDEDALFMGLGDIVIPGVLVVSSMVFLGGYEAAMDTVLGLSPSLFVALSTLLGATIGFIFLMRGVLQGTPHAGLPSLNGGALVGFLIPLFLLYGIDPVIPVF